MLLCPTKAKKHIQKPNQTIMNNQKTSEKSPKQEKLKYAIKAALAQFTASVQAEKRKEIREACGINNNSTLSEWENIKQGDARIIPYDYAVIICRVLGWPLDKFLNK